jgi:hypothetical protein
MVQEPRYLRGRYDEAAKRGEPRSVESKKSLSRAPNHREVTCQDRQKLPCRVKCEMGVSYYYCDIQSLVLLGVQRLIAMSLTLYLENSRPMSVSPFVGGGTST